MTGTAKELALIARAYLVADMPPRRIPGTDMPSKK